MRDPRGAMDYFTLPNRGHSALTFVRAAMKLHVALDHVHHFVARIDMELAPMRTTTGYKGQGIGRLPEDTDGPRGVFEGIRDLGKVDGRTFIHRTPFLRRSTRRRTFLPALRLAVNDAGLQRKRTCAQPSAAAGLGQAVVLVQQIRREVRL